MAEINKATVGGVTYDIRDASAVKTVNGSKPDESGNVAIAIPSITVDNAPTSGSSNPVSSGGVYTALSKKGEVKTVNGTSPDASGNVTVSVDIPDVPSAGTDAPKQDGVASAGSAETWSRSDHVHPTDTSRAASSHTHAASGVTAGTFAGQVVANSSGQTPGTMLLRNCKLVSEETTPTVNGEICWTYE